MRARLHPLLDWPALSADYARYHRTRGNLLCHAVGIPLIVLAVVAWTRVPGPIPLPLAVLALPLYFAWDPRLGTVMSAAFIVLAWAAAHLPRGGALAAFAAGWVFQFVGHARYEGRSPAFLRNGVHLLVGPAWILREVLFP